MARNKDNFKPRLSEKSNKKSMKRIKKNNEIINKLFKEFKS